VAATRTSAFEREEWKCRCVRERHYPSKYYVQRLRLQHMLLNHAYTVIHVITLMSWISVAFCHDWERARLRNCIQQKTSLHWTDLFTDIARLIDLSHLPTSHSHEEHLHSPVEEKKTIYVRLVISVVTETAEYEHMTAVNSPQPWSVKAAIFREGTAYTSYGYKSKSKAP
jgi:hypothetical protein